MNENEFAETINSVQILMNIQSDVAVIKNDVNHVKEEMRKTDNTILGKMEKLEHRLTSVEDKVDKLENKETELQATKYKKATAFILTALGGMFVVKLPEIGKIILDIFK